MEKINFGAGMFTIKEFLSPLECQQYIDYSELKGYEEATVQARAGGSMMLKEVRNNDRVIFDDAALAEKLFTRAREFLPEVLNDWRLLGLNERFRFYRYEPGQFFKWHKDGYFIRSETEVSLLTFIIYLNDGYEGGATEFSWEIIHPEIGTALVFPHKMNHQGAVLSKGVKYVLRTDVMYQK
jgi:prolyl 4-hydroxylase